MDRIGVRGSVGVTGWSRAAWAALVLAAVLIAWAAPGRAADLYVPGEYSTIQAAIDAAVTGDTVHVAANPEPYAESLTIILKHITLVGAGAGQTTVQPASGRCLYMQLSNGTVSGFTFTGGSAADGGGIYLEAAGPTITNSIITGCSATRGGGIFFDTTSTADVINCVVAENTATSKGGGMFMYKSAPTQTNVTITANAGGGIDATGGGNPPATNCIISGNTVANDVKYLYPPAITYSCIGSGMTGGTGNVYGDPLFVSSDDYHLQPLSPCIDAGSNDAPELPACDLDGKPRILPEGGTVDMGAYEFGTTNEPPVAVPDAYDVDEDGTLEVAAPGVLGNDLDEGALHAELVDLPTNGTVILATDGSFNYTPDANFCGTDSFTYYATDGELDSEVVTVTITVNPINDAPEAQPDAYAVDEDGILDEAAPGVLANDTDIDSTLAAVLLDDVDSGILGLDPNGSFTYVPDPDFCGTDSFTYQASDGELYSAEVTVTITVNPINDAPVANGDGPYLGTTGFAVTFDGQASTDADSDPLTYKWDFGDGIQDQTTEPLKYHAYVSEGVYTVTLVVNDGTVDSAPYTTQATINGEGGQRDDVDAFITYVQPADRDITLPEGRTSYDVIIVYGITIDPETFEAELNKQPCDGFTPIPGGTETVTITLQAGKKNKLRIQVDGERVDGKTATDKDKLTFRFP